MEKLYTRQEVASILKVHVRTVDRMLTRDDIPIIPVGDRIIRIPESSLELILRTKTMSGGERKDLFKEIYTR